MAPYAIHPFSVGTKPDELAVAYHSFCADPLPDRPREIVCELMHYDPTNIPPNAHINLNHVYIMQKVFVKSCRGLVDAARQGRYEWHLAEGRHRKIVPQEGTLSGLDLYHWGQLFKKTDYIAAVNVRARAAKVAARAVASDLLQEDGGMEQVHKLSDGKRAHVANVEETEVEVKAEGGVQVDAAVVKSVWNRKRQRFEVEEYDSYISNISNTPIGSYAHTEPEDEVKAARKWAKIDAKRTGVRMDPEYYLMGEMEGGYWSKGDVDEGLYMNGVGGNR